MVPVGVWLVRLITNVLKSILGIHQQQQSTLNANEKRHHSHDRHSWRVLKQTTKKNWMEMKKGNKRIVLQNFFTCLHTCQMIQLKTHVNNANENANLSNGTQTTTTQTNNT